MRILIVSPIATHPQNAGHRSRIFFLTQKLRELGHDVHFLYLRTSRQAKDDHLPAMKKEWGNFASLDYAEGENMRRSSGKICLSHIRRVDDWFDDGLEAPIRAHFESVRPQAVVVMYASISRLLDYFSFPVLKILDTHDVHANRNEQLLAHNIPLSDGYSFSPEEEAKALLRSDLLLAIQKNDAEYFKKAAARPVVELGLWTPVKNKFSPRNKNNVVFFSSANQVGLANFKYFFHQIWPRIQSQCPEARLSVAGTICQLIEEKAPSLTLEGYQETLDSFFESARVVVSAEVFATGISTKNRTALGFGMPLVTSPLGARGLKDTDAFLVGRNAEEFSKHVLSVLEDDSLASGLSEKARFFVEQKNAEYLNVLKDLFA